MAVSISRPGKSPGAKRGARERASAIKWVFPGTQQTSKENMATFSLSRWKTGASQDENVFLENTMKRPMICIHREQRETFPVVIGTPAKKGQPSLLAQYVNNCDRTGKTEDPWELPLMTTTTITKTFVHRYTGAPNKPQCQQTQALPHINTKNHGAVTDVLSLKVRDKLTDVSKHILSNEH